MKKKTLYPFQQDAVGKILGVIESQGNPVLVAPTGSGKTVMAISLIKNLILREKNVFFYAIAGN